MWKIYVHRWAEFKIDLKESRKECGPSTYKNARNKAEFVGIDFINCPICGYSYKVYIQFFSFDIFHKAIGCFSIRFNIFLSSNKNSG